MENEEVIKRLERYAKATARKCLAKFDLEHDDAWHEDITQSLLLGGNAGQSPISVRDTSLTFQPTGDRRVPWLHLFAATSFDLPEDAWLQKTQPRLGAWGARSALHSFSYFLFASRFSKSIVVSRTNLCFHGGETQENGHAGDGTGRDRRRKYGGSPA